MNIDSSFSSRCRLCLSESRLSLKFYDPEAKRLDLLNKITFYLSIHISLDDGFPDQICYECLSRIEIFHNYKQSCLEAQYTLKHWDLFCHGGSSENDVSNINNSLDNADFHNGERFTNTEERKVPHSSDSSPKRVSRNSPETISNRSLEISPRILKQNKIKRNSHAGREMKQRLSGSRAAELENNTSQICDDEFGSCRMSERTRNRKVQNVSDVSNHSSQRSHIKQRSQQTGLQKKGQNLSNRNTGLKIPFRQSSSKKLKNQISHEVSEDGITQYFYEEHDLDEVRKSHTEQKANTMELENVVDTPLHNVDFSTQRLINILESDDESSYQSEVETSHALSLPSRDTSKQTTANIEKYMLSEKRNPMTAFVKVEKLTLKDDAESSDANVNIGSSQNSTLSKSPRAKSPKSYIRVKTLKKLRMQSNQFRLVKPVKDDVTGRVRYKCLRCGSLMANKQYINEHMKIHTGDKSFACFKCDRAFRNAGMLKSHMSVHETERKFECAHCGHSFTGKERLLKHLKLHQDEFVCPICERKCNQKQSLQRHMRVHTGERPYKCDFCESAFSDRSTWSNHRRIHTGEKPYKCKLCSKTFSRMVNRHAHMRSHSDVRPFQCQLCMSKFKTKAHLVKHLSSIHSDLMKSVVTAMKQEVLHNE